MNNAAAAFLANFQNNVLVPPTDAARADYNAMQKRITSGDLVQTPGYLRMESASLGATSAVDFTMAENAGAQTVTEKRLKLNDAFLATHIGLFIGVRLTADVVSAQELHSFANPAVFTTAASLNAVRAFYNAQWGVRMNATVLVDGIDVLSCRRADTAQQGVAVSAVATVGIYGGSFWGQDSAFKAMTPNLLFNGTGNNVVSVKLPESVTFTLASTTITMVCICRGWLLQNGGTQRSER